MQSTINFNDGFGDISFKNGDIDIVRDRDKTDILFLIKYFKTSYDDIEVIPEFGLDIDYYIGKPIDTELAETLKTRIQKALITNKIIIRESDAEVLYIIKKNTIYFRLVLSDRESYNFKFLKEIGFDTENE